MKPECDATAPPRVIDLGCGAGEAAELGKLDAAKRLRSRFL